MTTSDCVTGSPGHCPIDCRCDNHRPGPSGLQQCSTARAPVDAAAGDACPADEAPAVAIHTVPLSDSFQLIATQRPRLDSSCENDPLVPEANEEADAYANADAATLADLKACMDNRFARMYRFVSDVECRLEARLGAFAGVVQVQRAAADNASLCLTNPCLHHEVISHFSVSTRGRCAALYGIARQLPSPNHSRLIPIAAGFLGTTVTGLVTLPVGLGLIPVLAPYGLFAVVGTLATTVAGGVASWAIARAAAAAHNRSLCAFHTALENTVNNWNTQRLEVEARG